jgi:hypothetical protein
LGYKIYWFRKLLSHYSAKIEDKIYSTYNKLIYVEANGFDFDSYWKSWILSRFVSISERIAANNKGTDLDYGNYNSTLFNSTTESDELN